MRGCALRTFSLFLYLLFNVTDYFKISDFDQHSITDMGALIELDHQKLCQALIEVCQSKSIFPGSSCNSGRNYGSGTLGLGF